MHQLMAYFPRYLAHFYLTYDYMMHKPAPLPLPWRNYIAILAAAQLSSAYLVDAQVCARTRPRARVRVCVYTSTCV